MKPNRCLRLEAKTSAPTLGTLRQKAVIARAVVTLAIALAAPARADQGAFSIEAGGGGAAIFLRAPHADAPKTQLGTAFNLRLGIRYAIRNWLEVTLNGFFEPPVRYFHNAVTVVTADGRFPGTLVHDLHRSGVLAGVRFVHGMEWRLAGGLEVGWSRRTYYGLRHIDDSSSGEPFDYGLRLEDFATDNFVLAPSIGVEWAFADRWSVSAMTRAEVLVGTDPAVAISAVLLFSYSWYL